MPEPSKYGGSLCIGSLGGVVLDEHFPSKCGGSLCIGTQCDIAQRGSGHAAIV